MTSTLQNPPDLRDIRTWVFDLDNTLYPAASSLFPQIDKRMRGFIAERLGLSLDDAFTLQKRYYREYGTTLRGMMTVHGTDPAEFLHHVHDIDHSVLDPAPRLDRALAALPGRKLIFTNGSQRHAEAVLARLGIAHHFEAVFDIVATGFLPKPDPVAYELLVRRFAFDPATAVMVEDIHRNLVPAAALGMATVWLRADEHPDFKTVVQDDSDLSHVHHVIDDLAPWLESQSPPR